MKYRRIDPQSGLLSTFQDYDDRIKKVETRTAGDIVIRETLKTQDPVTGVETILGKLPDGSIGFQPFVGDIEPPPVPTAPQVATEPGVFVVSWDGKFVGDAEQPRDFQHVNILAYKLIAGVPQSPALEIGVIRLPIETVFVTTDVCAVGESWRFVLQSEDYNGNLSVEGANSPNVTMLSAVSDVGVNAALEALQEDADAAAQAAQDAQTSANTAQGAAEDAAQSALDAANLAGTKGTVYTQVATPAADMNGLWIDTGHSNIPRRYLGVRKALAVHLPSSSATIANRLTALGWDTTTVTATPTLEDALKYDLVAFDAGFSGLGTTMATRVRELWENGVSVFTTGNDTTTIAPMFTGASSRGTPKNSIRATANAMGITHADYTDTDLNFYLTGVNASAIVTGVTLVGSLAEDRPLNIVMEHPTNFNRWVHIQTFGTPVSVLNAHLNWLSNNWVAIQDQGIITAAKAAEAANNLAAGKSKVHYVTSQPSVIGNSVGDMWVDIDDSYKLYTWSGSAWTPTQDSQAAINLANTKIKSFVQASEPVGTTVGDIWLDTDNKNELFRWNGSSWVSYRDLTILDADGKASQAIANAATAQDTADGKVATYFQTGQPTGQTAGDVGDLWFDTDDGNKMWRWTGSAWVIADDQRIAATVTAAANAKNIADSKITTFYQDDQPSSTGRTIGDLWVDTNDNNKLSRWNGTIWQSARDLTIASVSNSAAAALEAAQAAQTAAEAAQAVADGSIRTWYQANAPTGLNNTTDVGDLWFDTDNGQASRWTGSAWTLIQDNAIAAALSAAQDAQTTADGKITSFYQPGQPATGDIGDLWFDTDDKNKPYYCSSVSPLTWTQVRDGAISDAQSTANTALTSANGKNKTYYQTAKPTGGTYIVGDTWVDTDDKNKLYVYNGSDFVNAQDGAIGDALTAAASKGKVIIQSAAPDVADRLPQNLWIDTTGGSNIPKRWVSGTTWAAVTDKTATDAAAAAVAAQTKADQAFNNAATAATAAGTAQTTADGKNRVWYQTAPPAGTSHKDGDIWFDIDDGNKLHLWKGAPTNAWTAFQDGAISIAQTAANNAASAASAAQTTATNAQTAAGNAATAASDAQGTANTAVSNAAAADSKAVQAAADALAASNLAASKGKVLVQGSAPTGADANLQTLWIDTTGGANTPKKWVSGTTWTAVTDKTATDAASLAASKGKVLVQTSAPTGADANTSTLWIDSTGGANTPKRWVSGTTWTAVTDKVASDAASLAATKGKVLIQSTTPIAADQLPQNLWIDTTGGNNTPKRWNTTTSQWDVVTDKVAVDAAATAANAASAASAAQGTANTAVSNAATAQTLAQQAFDNAASAATAAGNAQGTANGKNRVWYQDDAPTGTGHTAGDIWFDTNDGNKPYVWKSSPTNTWLTARDASIATAQSKADSAFSVANGKNTTYYQTSEPSGGTYIKGDLWFDTDAAYKLYTYNGSIWQATQDSAGAITTAAADATSKANAAQTAAATDAQTKATAAQQAAIAAAASDAASKAATAKSEAISAAASDAQSKADTAKQQAIDAAALEAQLIADGAEQAAIDAASADATSKANAAKAAAEAAAAITAQAKADAAQAAAISAAATDATNKANAAEQAALIAASKLNAFSGNASFEEWSGSQPNGYTVFTQGATKETTLIRSGKQSARFNVTNSATSAGIAFSTTSVVSATLPNIQYYTVELEFYLVSGTLPGAGVILDWAGMTNNRATINLNTEVPGAATGKWYRVTKVLQRPANATGTWTGMSGYIMANWSTLGQATKDIIFDWFNIRPSTAEEITSFNTPAAIAAKSATYYDPSKPTGGTYKKGDIWVDTDDGNKMYVHNGTDFVSAQDGAITTALTAANGKNKVIYSTSAASGTTGYIAGDTWFQKDNTTGIILGQWEFTTSWQSRTIGESVIGNLSAGKITSGEIAAGLLNAEVIKAKLIAASFIAAEDIFASNSITSASGIFGTMDASVINAGVIAAARLDAAIIRGKLIEADLIDAIDIIASNSITATNGIIGSLDISKATAGTLHVNRLGAKSISVDKLLVSSTDNIVNEADFSGAGASWQIASDTPTNAGFTINATGGRNGLPAMSIANSASLQTSWNSVGAPTKTPIEFQTSGGNQYRVSAWVMSSVNVPASGAYLEVRFRLANGTYESPTQKIVYTTGTPPVPAAIAASTTVWTEIAGIVTAPPTAISMAISINSAATLTTGTLKWDSVSMTRAANGQLIIDGSVTADKMALNSITATNGIIASLDVSKVTAGSMSGSFITAKSLLANRLVISSTDNLILEADFSNNGTSWDMTGTGKSIQATAGRGSLPAFRVTGVATTVTSTNLVNKIPVGTEDRFRGSFYVKSSAALAADKVQLKARCYTSAAVPPSNTDVVIASNKLLTAGVWTLVEGFSEALPANTIALEFYLSATNGATGVVTDIDYVGTTRAADGKLVVDGAIDGKIITGATFRTSATAQTTGGIIYDALGFRAYSPSGQQTFSISAATGNIESTGYFSTTGSQVSGIPEGGTMSIGATFGSFTYASHTDFTGVPGIKFSRVHSSQGAKTPSAIFYDGQAIEITTADLDSGFTANSSFAKVRVGQGGVTLAATRMGANSGVETPEVSMWVASSELSPMQESIGSRITNRYPDGEIRSIGLDINGTSGSGYVRRGYADGKFTAALVHRVNQASATKLGESRMEVGDGGVWNIFGRKHDGNLATQVSSRMDYSTEVALGILDLSASDRITLGSAFGGSGTLEVRGGVTQQVDVNGKLVVSSNAELPVNTTVGGSTGIMSYQGITKTQISYGTLYSAYAGFATPTYWRDSIRVSLSGVIGINIASATFSGGSTYDLGSIPSAYAPDQNILFSPLVGPLMSANCIFYVMSTGALRLYVPTTATLSQSNFYVGMDGMSWLRKQ